MTDIRRHGGVRTGQAGHLLVRSLNAAIRSRYPWPWPWWALVLLTLGLSIALGLCLTGHAHAQTIITGRVPFSITKDCTKVTSPAAGVNECLDTTRGVWNNYDGTRWQSDPALATKVVNVMDWGAKGDGVANDTTAIQAAITYACGLSPRSGETGTLVFFPEGDYGIKSPGLSTRAGCNTSFAGSGRNSILEWLDTGAGTILTILGTTASPTAQISIRDLHFYVVAPSPAGVVGLKFGTTGTGNQIVEVLVENNKFTGLAQHVVVNSEVDEMTWFHNYFAGGGTSGGTGGVSYAVVGANGNHHFLYNQFQGVVGWAVNAVGTSSFQFYGNTIQSAVAGSKGVQLDNIDTWEFRNNYFEWDPPAADLAISIGPSTLTETGTISTNHFNLNNTTIGITLDRTQQVALGPNTWQAVATAINITANAGWIDYKTQYKGPNVTTMLADARNTASTGFGVNVIAPATLAHIKTLATGATNFLRLEGLTNQGLGLQFFSAAGSVFSWIINDNFNGTASQLEITPSTLVNGTTFTTPVVMFTAGGGMQVGSATGGAPTSGTLNISAADGYLVNNTALKNIAEILSNKTLASPAMTGTVAGTYTLGGTPTLNSALAFGVAGSLTAPVLSGTATGTYTLGGTPTLSGGTLTGSTKVVNLAVSSTAPTLTGFCTNPSVPANNGTIAFTVNVGTACAVSTGTINLPTATTGWVCEAHDLTTPASNLVEQSSGTVSTADLTNYSRTTGLAANFTSSDVLSIQCAAY